MVRGIVFDLDGTLVRLPVDWRLVVDGLSKMLNRRVVSLVKLYPLIWGSPNYEVVSRYVESYELKAIDNLLILDDSPNILMKLHSKYKLGLVTFQGLNVVKRILEKLNLSHLFEGISTRDDAPTREEQISQVISSFNLKASDILVVGDRLNDVFSASKLGCKAALIDRYGRKLGNSLLKTSYVIYTLEELFELLN